MGRCKLSGAGAPHDTRRRPSRHIPIGSIKCVLIGTLALVANRADLSGGAGVGLGVTALEVGVLSGTAHVVAIGAAEWTDETVSLLVMVGLDLLVLVENWGAKLSSDFAAPGELILLTL